MGLKHVFLVPSHRSSTVLELVTQTLFITPVISFLNLHLTDTSVSIINRHDLNLGIDR